MMNAEQVVRSLSFLNKAKDFVELHAGDGLRIDLRYAGTNNFVGHDMYGPFRQAFLHKIAAQKLSTAFRALRASHPGFGFVIFDALRPRSVQRVLWDHVKGTDGESYIANPDNGSLHNFGFAVDLSVTDKNGRELDMGAGYDDFRPISQPKMEAHFLEQGLLTQEQLQNRLILRGAMEAAGFIQLQHEWWHYDAMTKAEVREKFKIVE
jgi:D-alanyl-D-alanine dipeptidase